MFWMFCLCCPKERTLIGCTALGIPSCCFEKDGFLTFANQCPNAFYFFVITIFAMEFLNVEQVERICFSEGDCNLARLWMICAIDNANSYMYSIHNDEH